jgi:ABC-2 type transport system ATP-binding protein
MTAPAIAISGVVKRYGRIVALDGVGFDVERGALFALLGPNGAGKTTLMHILCTLLQPDAGQVRIGGVDALRTPRLARRGVGVVFQEPSLDDRLSLAENLEFHGLVHGVPGRLRRARIAELLELVELTDWRDRLVRSLSPGMKRRLEIARALVHDSRILFLDEPTAGLDPQTRGRIWEHLARLRRERELTIIVTTHAIDEAEACDRVCIIDRGAVVALDTPAALKAAHGQQHLRVAPRSEADAAAILAEHATARQDGNEILLHSSGDAFAEAFLARHGGRIRRLAVEDPSLETVFLTLTGHALRDHAAGARERTQAFARQGGEHTR